MVAAMQGHAENAAVQENACMAPISLAANTEIEMKIAEENGIKVLLRPCRL